MILLIPSFPYSYWHTPRLVSLLNSAGKDVAIAAESGTAAASMAFELTGRDPVDLKCGKGKFKAIVAAPCAKLPEINDCISGKLLIAPVMEAELKVPDGISVIQPLESKEKSNCYGRLGEVTVASPETCLEAILAALTPQDFAGRTIILTAGPTIEDADPARFISNRSTGKMGTAIARMAARRGARVLLVHGPMAAEIPSSSNIIPIPVRSAQNMCDAVMEHLREANIAILCAAVADFAPVQYSEEKIKKGKSQFFDLKMRRTPDILATVGASPDKPFLVGFAAESNNVRDNAMDKLVRKNCDMLCANDIMAPGCGFAVSTNRLLVFGRDGSETEIPLASKESVANSLLDMIARARLI